MIYNANNELDIWKARKRLEWLIMNRKRFELTEKRPRRTLSQNNYLHLALSYYALEMGEEMEYVKQYIFKQIVCSHIFKYDRINRKTGEIRLAYKSTANLDTKELTDAIECFRNHASKDLGIYIPEPSDLALIDQMENEINRNKQYL